MGKKVEKVWGSMGNSGTNSGSVLCLLQMNTELQLNPTKSPSGTDFTLEVFPNEILTACKKYLNVEVILISEFVNSEIITSTVRLFARLAG